MLLFIKLIKLFLEHKQRKIRDSTLWATLSVLTNGQCHSKTHLCLNKAKVMRSHLKQSADRASCCLCCSQCALGPSWNPLYTAETKGSNNKRQRLLRWLITHREERGPSRWESARQGLLQSASDFQSCKKPTYISWENQLGFAFVIRSTCHTEHTSYRAYIIWNTHHVEHTSYRAHVIWNTRYTKHMSYGAPTI